MEAVSQMAAVGLVLLLLAGALWWLRRRGYAAPVLGRAAGARRLRAVERLPLGPNHSLHLVRMGDRALLVACGNTGCALLANLDWRELDKCAGAAP